MIAAVVGGVALIVVATIPLVWRRLENVRANRVDLLALRERVDVLANRVDEGQERRKAEHETIINLLRNGKGGTR